MNSVLVVLVALAGLLVDVDAQLVPYPYAPVPYAPVPADYGANYGGAGVYEDAAYNNGYGAAGYANSAEQGSRIGALYGGHRDIAAHGAHGHSVGHHGRASLLHRDRAFGYEKKYGYDRVYSNAHGYGEHDAAYGNHGHQSSAGGYGLQQDEQFGRLAHQGYGQHAVALGHQNNAYGNMLLGGYGY